MARDVIIKSTHRGLRYEDGRLTGVLEAGRYQVPERQQGRLGGRRPLVEIVVVDMRERELTIKGQEILTADKVAIRVSILTQFKVTEPVAAVGKGRLLRGSPLQRRPACSSPGARVHDAGADPDQPQSAQRGHPQ